MNRIIWSPLDEEEFRNLSDTDTLYFLPHEDDEDWTKISGATIKRLNIPFKDFYFFMRVQ